jgi:hypothetical protein
MRRSTAMMSVAAVAFVATNAFAQAKSFAGTWTLVPDTAAAAQQMGGAGGRGGRGPGGFGQTFTATQDAKTLTIARTTQNGEVKSVYNLDGSDSKNSVMGRGGEAMEVVSKAKMDGDKLVITTTQDFNGTARTSTQTISLDAAGNLWVESNRPGRDGNPMVTKVQYKKS